MPESPRYVPPLPASLSQSWWYCLECGTGRSAQSEITVHWKATHEGGWERDAELGVDYTRGSDFMLKRGRYEEWIENQACHFCDEMHPGFGPEDFVAEAEIREA